MRVFYSCVLSAIVCCLIYPAELAAQHRSNDHWIFGYQIRMNFSDVAPQYSVIDGFETYEAASSISDPESGNLILYTNGVDVWNGVLDQINGDDKLAGHKSSTQGALIMPESCNRYYIFTSDAGEYEGINDGVHYTLVDMTLNEGRGGLVDGAVNIQLMQQAAEKLTAAPHADGRSYWLMARGMRDGKFHAFHVSLNGIASPVISDVGFALSGFRATDGVGAMKFSPDGKKMALAMFVNEKIELYDFDNQTGELYNRVDLGQALESYGVEFSPDSRKLYVTTVHERANRSRLYQFDLNAQDIKASRTIIYEDDQDLQRLSGMQLGPDGKIYISRLENEYLQVINQPNRPGRACNLTEVQLPFGARCGLGMMNLYTGPPVILVDPNANDLTVSEDVTICPGESVQLLAENAFGGSFQWLPRAGLSDPNSQSPTAAPLRTTTYIVSVNSPCGDDLDSVTVFVRPAPELEILANNIPLCPGENVQLRASGADDIRWEAAPSLSDPDIADPIVNPIETTTYTAIGRNADGCEVRKDVTVRVFPGPQFDLGPDVTLCPGQSLRLRAGSGIEYRWWPDIEISSTDIARPEVRPSQSRTYYVEVTDDVGCSRIDSIRVRVGSGITLPNEGRYAVCEGEAVRLEIEGPEGEYRWFPIEGLDDPRSRNPVASPTRSMTYTVSLESDCGRSEREVAVEVFERPQYTLADVSACHGDAVDINPNAAADLRYFWEAGQGIADRTEANPRVIALEEKVYYLNISNGRCSVRDSLRVTIEETPPLNIQADNSRICNGDSVQLSVSGAETYRWEPRSNIDDFTSANPRVFPSETTTYYVRGSNAQDCEPVDSITIVVEPAPELVLSPPDPTICAGQTIQVVIPDNSTLRSVQWTPPRGLNNPNVPNPLITVTNTTLYTVEYEYDSGCRGSVQYLVEVAAPPKIELDQNSVRLCEGEVLTVNASGAEEILWFDQNDQLLGTGESWEVKHNDGRLRAVGRSGVFCADTVDLVVVNLGRTALRAVRDYNVCYGDTVLLEAFGAARYEWSPADDLDDPTAGSTLAWPLLNTSYTLRAFNENGCEVTETVNLRLVPRVDIVLAAESPEGGALPGDEIVFRMEFTLREELRELLDQNEFAVIVDHRNDGLQILPTSLRRVSGLPDWNFVINNLDEPGKFELYAAGANGATLENRFVLEFTMRVLLLNSDTEFLDVSIASSDFGAKVSCGDLDSTTVQLSTFCLRTHRGIRASGIQFALLQNQPNPANGTTEILYRLGFDTHVSLQLTDNLGRVIDEVVDARQDAGVHRLQLNTSELAAGIYRYVLRAGPFQESKVLLIE